MADTVTVPVEYLSELEAAVASQKTTIKEMSADIALLREECNYLKHQDHWVLNNFLFLMKQNKSVIKNL